MAAQNALDDPTGIPGRKFRVEERLTGKLAKDIELVDHGAWASDGSESQAKTAWGSMEAAIRAGWLQVGHRVWVDAYYFLLFVYQQTRRRDLWRFPNPATYLLPAEWAKSVDPYARRTGLDRVVARVREITTAIKDAATKV